MKIIRLGQQDDREAWLDLRRGKIMGTKAKTVRPLKRGDDRTPIGFWELLAERLAVAKDGEPEMDRGHRLENEAILHTGELFGKEFDLNPGVWVSGVDEDIAVSPDAAELSLNPTYAAEAKCLDSKHHLKILLTDRRLQKNADYRPFDSIPKEYRDQVVQYFVVNTMLETLYWTLYDDRIAYDNLIHHVIVVDREDIQEEIQEQLEMEVQVLKDVKAIIKEAIHG